ncbi:hypothetical protein N182_28155 [Sinorhizobium sp. GL2]|nr:hypothetical protein N182_28155 [Sinorhizobium sp. GL2]
MSSANAFVSVAQATGACRIRAFDQADVESCCDVGNCNSRTGRKVYFWRELQIVACKDFQLFG